MVQELTVYSLKDFDGLRKAGRLAAQVLDYITPFVKPGVSTGELDDKMDTFITEHGGRTACRGYNGYPKCTCISPNHVICHGIPSYDRILEDGDIINIDVTVIVNGWYGDTSRMYYVGKPSVKARRLVETTYATMMAGINAVKPGGYLGDAEARGQGQAIAACIDVGLDLKVPIVATIIGEGGSGGALALAVGNKILMLENAIYSVISPEGCASILWKDFKFAKQATRALKLTAKDLLALGVIDEVIPEPIGGAHRFPKETFSLVKKSLENALKEIEKLDAEGIILQRQEKFLEMGRPKQKKKNK